MSKPNGNAVPVGDRRSVLILGNYRPVLTLARELAPQGYRIIVARGLGEGFCEYSRFVDEHWDHPEITERDAFLTALREFLEARPDIGIVYPVFEDYVRLIAQEQKTLPDDRLYAMPAGETVLATLDKTRMARLAKSLDVPTARFEIVDCYGGLLSAAETLGFPVVVRPQESGEGVAGKKALICATADDLARALPSWPAAHRTLMVQRYVSGPRYNHYFAARGGSIFRLLETRILETELVDGTGFAVSGITEAVSRDLYKYSRRLVAELDYTGVGLVQYMVDRDNRTVTFVELNPRIVGSHVIAEAMGLELSRLSIDLAEKHYRSEAVRIGTSGTPYVWTYGALRGLRTAVANGELSRGRGLWALSHILLAAVGARVHMVFRWDDPLPAVMLFLDQIPKFRRLVSLFPARKELSFPAGG